jgi:hypothetical protein
MSRTSEEFVRHYLRLNGFFTIDNFIVHAGDDPHRIDGNGMVGNYTETDILGIRLANSKEITKKLYIANDPALVDIAAPKTEIIIGEAKIKKQDKPNKAWKNEEDLKVKKYILNFIGLFDDDKRITSIAESISKKYHFCDENIRVRYIIFSEIENEHYKMKGVSYVLYDHMIDFLVNIRGQSWIDANIGVASVHQQWPMMLRDIFNIANDQNIKMEERKIKIKEIILQE